MLQHSCEAQALSGTAAMQADLVCHSVAAATAALAVSQLCVSKLCMMHSETCKQASCYISSKLLRD